MTFDVAVIGSINQDLTIHTRRHPGPGETVLGTSHHWAQGGKGANQAVAAARMGSTVAMMGAVGDDESGRALVSSLKVEGIDTSGVRTRQAAATGLAVITVDSDAENTIVVSPGANLTITPDALFEHSQLISEARVVLTQLEVPIETVIAAANLATGIVCLNPAPFQPLPSELVDRVDVLIPNRTELSQLVGNHETDAVAAAQGLDYDCAVVATLGAEGAAVIDGADVTQIPSPSVEAVDPTGAGDGFCGAVASGLAAGLDLVTTVRRAVIVGALATTRHGAQPSMPTVADVESFAGT